MDWDWQHPNSIYFNAQYWHLTLIDNGGRFLPSLNPLPNEGSITFGFEDYGTGDWQMHFHIFPEKYKSLNDLQTSKSNTDVVSFMADRQGKQVFIAVAGKIDKWGDAFRLKEKKYVQIKWNLTKNIINFHCSSVDHNYELPKMEKYFYGVRLGGIGSKMGAI